MLVAAVSDVHSPRFLPDLERALTNLDRKPGILLLAGDIVLHGDVEQYNVVLPKVLDAVGRGTRVFAVFGNEEYDELRAEIRGRFSEVTWLEEEAAEAVVGDDLLYIVGSTGALDRPTGWQAHNIPGIRERYARRVEVVRQLLAHQPQGAMTILLLHYAPTTATVVGEREASYPWMASRAMGAVLEEAGPRFCIHGHAHLSKVHTAVIGRTVVYNVALPATGRITLIDTAAKSLEPRAEEAPGRSRVTLGRWM